VSRAIPDVNNLVRLSLETAITLLSVNSVPVLIYRLEIIWEHPTVRNLEATGKSKRYNV
jgi:hypothetical protein